MEEQNLQPFKTLDEGIRRTLQASLTTKSWFLFDLDDTLHEYRKAAGIATSAALRPIADNHNIPFDDLRESYFDISTQVTKSAFIDGRTSIEYRLERFMALLERFSIPRTPMLLESMLNNYEVALQGALELKKGAKNLLTVLRSLDKKIVVVTEGPQDSQEWTLEKLGLSNLVGVVATSNGYRTSKPDGLLKAVMEQLRIEKEDVVFVGDNWDRDVLPAFENGVLSVHYCEKEEAAWNGEILRVNRLETLEEFLKETGNEPI